MSYRAKIRLQVLNQKRRLRRRGGRFAGVVVVRVALQVLIMFLRVLVLEFQL